MTGSETSPEELDVIVASAAEVTGTLEAAGRGGRARLLDAIAEALEEDRQAIVALADRESSLGAARLDGELARTSFQLRFLADVVRDGAYLEATVDHAGDSPMGPRPDLRRMLRPLGPVGVFGASNFPLAFSVAGGDTASALAAGCAVVTKAHPAHPATALRCAEAIAAGARRAGFDERVVTPIFGDAAGVALVQHPGITAVGFTGSLAGGRFLADLAAARPSPIPFYGELGAQNAVVVTPGAAAERAAELAEGLAGSFSLGVGQFCTKPGLAMVPAGEAGDRLVDGLAAAVRALPGGPMLTAAIAGGYAAGVATRRDRPGVRLLATGAAGERSGWWGEPALLEAEPAALVGELVEECFGPVLVVVRYRDQAELGSLIDTVPPGLTGSVHASEDEAGFVAPVLDALAAKVGRLVWNGYPTGVAVAWAMHHGGPYPATTDPLHTSVGATAIRRWLRPIAYQGVPEWALPAELRDLPPPPSAVPRRVDGRLELPGA